MLQSMGLERVRHDLMTEQQFIYLFGCSVAHRILVAEQGKLLEKERVSETSLPLKMRLELPVLSRRSLLVISFLYSTVYMCLVFCVLGVFSQYCTACGISSPTRA